MPSASALQAVLDVLDLARSDRFADIPGRFAPTLRPLVQPQALAHAWNAELARQGPVASIAPPLTEAVPPAATLVKVPVACERGGFTLVAAATDQGQLLSLQLAPPEAAAPLAVWEPPDYADPGAFSEEEVTLAAGPRAVGGTLTAPRTAGPWGWCSWPGPARSTATRPCGPTSRSRTSPGASRAAASPSSASTR
jgi:hypothetical protein